MQTDDNHPQFPINFEETLPRVPIVTATPSSSKVLNKTSYLIMSPTSLSTNDTEETKQNYRPNEVKMQKINKDENNDGNQAISMHQQMIPGYKCDDNEILESTSNSQVNQMESKKVELAEAHTRVYDAFSRAFSRQNTQFERAIRSLDSLNDQIVEFVLNTGRENVDDPKQSLVLEPSVALMKKLLLDAQGKFRKMVEENQQLANRIDGELQSAHKEVDVLRRDLADTNKRISEMQATVKPTDQLPLAENVKLQEESKINNDISQPLTNGTAQCHNETQWEEQITILKEENDRLAERNVHLLREVDELRFLKDAILKYDDSNDTAGGAEGQTEMKLNPKVTKITLELTHAKEALAALKVDRKRLKAEKFDLLNQMKQLYATLEDKERELRDFIRNYEQRMKDCDESVRQLSQERDESEREKWNLLKHAREEAERAVNLASQLNCKDTALRKLEEELEIMRRQISSFGYNHPEGIKANGIPSYSSAFTPTSSHQPVSTPTPTVSTPTCSPLPLSSTTNGRGSSADSGVRLSSDRESTASHEVSSLTTAVERTPNPNGDSDGASICSSTATGASSSHYYYYYYGCGPGTPNKDGSSTIYANPSLLRDESRMSLARSEKLMSRENSSDARDNSTSTTPVNGNTAFGLSVSSNMAENVPNANGGSLGNPLSRSAEQLCERIAEAQEITPKGRCGTMTLTRKNHKGGGTWGSISRVFARQKKRAAIESSVYDGECNESSTEDLSLSNSFPQRNPVDKRASWSPGTSLCVSPLTEESYAEKIRLLEEAQHVPLERWKALTVLAWLEITLGMPQYGPMCAENVRSGKVLLELNDADLESGLGITHALHRKKLRLAIEELRDPRKRRFPKMSLISHNWVATEWLQGLGLPQYSEAFSTNLVDGRLLETMTKKELEKQLGVSRKFHQASIINGVHLLRIFRFDRQLLTEKRRQCENVDADPVVWTNYRWVRWARAIDLTEYADNLKDSGVHGALVVLENSFSADTMATALGIPSSKNIIRKHLATEFDNLIIPARRQMEEQARFAKMERRRHEKMASGGSLGRSFARNYATLERQDKDKIRTLRGSLSRAFGLKVRDELQNGPNSVEPIYSTPRGIPIHTLQAQSGPASAPPHPHIYSQNNIYGYHDTKRPQPIYGHVPINSHLHQQGRPRSSVVPSSVAAFNHRENHRRVRSISDIEHISSTVTPV